LRRLGTDHVDLMLVHWPTGEAPLGETLGALAELRRASKTRFIGVSNFTVPPLREAVETRGADLLCNQVEYHPFLSQRPVIAALARYGMMLAAYTPLARGRVARDETLMRVARAHGKSPTQAALRWLLDQKNVAAIPKAASAAHATANLDICDFAPAPEERAAIDGLRGNLRVLDPGWGPAWDPPDA
jgi:2,5-diketo-D-gluconate reductase B